MLKYFFSITIIFIFFYFLTFIISFINITNAIVENNHQKLENYILIDELKNNFKKDFDHFSYNLVNMMQKKINIDNDNIEFSGELSSNFLNIVLSRMSENISNDFSNPRIMLFFYFESKKISEYINQSIINLGYYNYERFLRENIQNSITKEEKSNEIKIKNNTFSNNKFNLTNTIKNLTNRIASTEYFFLSSPIHFKINVKHQDISFVVVFKFIGHKWKLQKIKIPYKELFEQGDIKLDN